MSEKLSCLLFLVVFLQENTHAQEIDSAAINTLKTTSQGHVSISGYIDTYYGYNFSNTNDQSIPYYVNSARNNQFQVNLAYIQLRYQAKGLRASFTPGVGTYMNDNYTSEPGTLKNIVDANVGVLLSEKRRVWIDVGVFTSPYTNESVVSKDQLMYTRSLGPENSPYYLAGAKLSVPINQKVNAYFYLLNGWQVIEDNNKGKSIGTQIEFKPNPKMLFNWNTYFGDERSSSQQDYRTRFFSDIYWIYQPEGRFSATSCVYFGIQKLSDNPSKKWWQANFIGRYAFADKWSLSGRVEYFSDPDLALLTPVTSVNTFHAFSSGLCLNYKVRTNALFRMEMKQLFSQDNLFLNTESQETKSNLIGVVSLTAWF